MKVQWQVSLVRACLVAPRLMILNAIGRIGHQQNRANIAEQPPDHIGKGAVAADQPVRFKLPQVARHRHRRDGRFRSVIPALDRAAVHLICIAQQGIQIFVGDPQQR